MHHWLGSGQWMSRLMDEQLWYDECELSTSITKYFSAHDNVTGLPCPLVEGQVQARSLARRALLYSRQKCSGRSSSFAIEHHAGRL